MKFCRFLAHVLVLALVVALIPGAEPAQAASSYYIEVDITNQYVTVFRTSDGAIVRQMICSTGASSTPTPTGTYTMPNRKYSSERKEWYCFGSSSYAKYASRIVGGILFHSYLYTSRRDSSVVQSSVRALGSQASHGCVRLRPADAQWIAYNCPAGTRVKIFRSGRRNNDIRSLLKQGTYSIDSGLAYDEYTGISTDPNTYGRGKTGAEVLELQRRLQGLGFYDGAADGIYGTATLFAVKLFQEAVGLHANGLADPQTREKVFSEAAPTSNRTTFAEGMSGPAIMPLQESLRALRLYAGEIDGVYDAEVAEAVRRWQRANSAGADGMANTALQTAAAEKAAELSAQFGEEDYGAIYIEDSQMMAQVRVSSKLTLRQGPSTNSRSLGKLGNGTQVAVRMRGRTWSQVQVGTVVGYLKNSYLRFYTRETATLVYGAGYLSSAEEIRGLQNDLISLGFMNGPATGVYDRATLEAVKLFQQAAGLEASGYAGTDTQSAVASEDAPTGTQVTFQENMSGRAIQKLQQALTVLKLYSGDIDGVYDADVVSAVRTFQQIYGYSTDGNASGDLQRDVLARAEALAARFGEAEYGMIYVSDQIQMAAVRVSSQLTLRQGPSTSSRSLGKLRNGTRVIVLARGGSWSQVQVGTVVGYLKNSYLRFYTQDNTILEYGEGYLSSPEEIAALQEKLISLGFMNGPATGVYDRATLEAVKLFQQAAGLEASGYAGTDTQSAVASEDAPISTSATLCEGMSGKAVKQLQQALTALKLYAGEIDGVYDADVAAAVQMFQHVYGYTEDGKATTEVQNAAIAKAAELQTRFGETEYEATYEEERILMARVKVNSTLTLRQGPSTSSRQLGKLRNGTDVLVLDKGAQWSQVQIGDVQGFLLNRYLRFYTITRVTYEFAEVSPEATGTPDPDATGTPDPDATGTPDPDATGTPDPDATGTPDPDATGTPDPDATGTPDPDPTGTPVPDPTGTPVPDPTGTPVPDGENAA